MEPLTRQSPPRGEASAVDRRSRAGEATNGHRPIAGIQESAEALDSERRTFSPRSWPYTWGRMFRFLSFPLDVLFEHTASDIRLLGAEHLANLPARVIFAGTHHSFADLPLLRWGLAHSPARRLVSRLIVTVGGPGFPTAGIYGKYATLAFGLFHLGRSGEGRGSLAAAAALARRGNAVLIFPQGQHARPERERAGDPAVGFRRGVAYLAQQMDAPVVPFGVAGTETMIPPFLEGFRGRVIAGIPVSLRRCPLTIAFGAPLALGKGEPAKEFAARLQEASYALTRQAEQLREGGPKVGERCSPTSD